MTRANNFDSLRLFGALAVIVGHACVLVGRPDRVPFLFGYPIHTLGVVVFFSISGYLITGSWLRRRHLTTYLASRWSRIFPGLICVVLVSILVIGPLFTSLQAREYWGSPSTWNYLWNIALKPRFQLPGVFSELPYPNVVNGSLWTLPAEFFCYLIVPIMCSLPRFAAVSAVSAFLILALWWGSVPKDLSPNIYGSRLSEAASMWVFFAAAALIRLIIKEFRAIWRSDAAVLLLVAYLLTIATWPLVTPWISWIALPYVILAVGNANTPVLRRASRYGDFSYGLYLWAFPVQQMVLVLFGDLGLTADIVLVTAITTLLAFLSWHFVESPSMNLKDRFVSQRQLETA